MKIAYDSSALLTLILQEREWQGVHAALSRAGNENYVPLPALTEVIVRARERGNASTPEQLRNFLESFGVIFVPLTQDDALRAAELIQVSRANPGVSPRGDTLTLSLGDALILAISERVSDNVVSKDRYWAALQPHLAVNVAMLVRP